MKKLLSGLVITMLMVACNNGETKADETTAKPADTVTIAKPATNTAASTLTTIVIAETPEAMAAELCRLNKSIKLGKAIGDMPAAGVAQTKYNAYNKMLKEKYGNDNAAKIIIKKIMEDCEKN
jgi:hypothetical protein